MPEAAYSALHLVQPWGLPDSSRTSRFIHRQRRAGDLVASDEAGYAYFFRGELRPIPETAAALPPPGQRVWVPMDYHTPAERRNYVHHFFRDESWECAGEVQFQLPALIGG